MKRREFLKMLAIAPAVPSVLATKDFSGEIVVENLKSIEFDNHEQHWAVFSQVGNPREWPELQGYWYDEMPGDWPYLSDEYIEILKSKFKAYYFICSQSQTNQTIEVF